MTIKLLYVDDEPINLQLLQISIKKHFDVVIANSGKEGLEILDEMQDIPIVVSDMKMPQMDGLEFISKAKEKYPSIQYYILTGYDTTKEISEALRDGLIIKKFKKPFNAKALMGELLQNYQE